MLLYITIYTVLVDIKLVTTMRLILQRNVNFIFLPYKSIQYLVHLILLQQTVQSFQCALHKLQIMCILQVPSVSLWLVESELEKNGTFKFYIHSYMYTFVCKHTLTILVFLKNINIVYVHRNISIVYVNTHMYICSKILLFTFISYILWCLLQERWICVPILQHRARC